MNKIKVVIIDDSLLIRRMLAEILEQAGDFEVVGTAADPLIARELIKAKNPDVITLDIEMPRMDGLEFLEKLMRLRPTPVVMISTLTERGAQSTLQALELGAIDFIAKPKADPQHGLDAFAEEVCEKLRAAAGVRLRPASSTPTSAGRSSPAKSPVRPPARSIANPIIAIGASTGGTEALKVVLTAIPAEAPPILITQHMPAGFTANFARRMDTVCAITVKEAEHHERVMPGHAYIAPGNRHMTLDNSGSRYRIVISDEPPVNRHRPSVGVLFDSVARWAGSNAVGIMLTGMGKDGAVAMLEMKRRGAFNLAQDEASCVVFGMPKEAIAVGAVDEILPLRELAQRALAHFGLFRRY